MPTDKKIQGYLPEPFSNRALARYPRALQAPRKSNRVAAQKGVFTLHGKLVNGLERYASLKGSLAKIEISAKKKSLMKEQLRLAGVSETSVFPELAALGRELVEYQKYEQSSKSARR